jgi:uncharacterized protein
MKTLTLGQDFKLPLNFATEGVAVIGMRGSGKSNTETRWCEVLHEAGVPFVVVDPKGDWGGIRSSADGKQPGLPIPVFGGITGDFPLTEHLGARIADLLVDQNLSAVLDVSLLSKEKRARFLTEFFDRLMQRHQQEPHVRCVVLEEAHRYIPQIIPQGPPNDKGLYARLKEAAAAVLLEGRAWGLGCWAATQRPARLHKDVLEEVGTAIIHRIGVAASNDLKTIRGWVQHEDLGPEIVPSLTKLKTGEAWVLAPVTLGITQRVFIDRRTTFDSASTPIVGAGSRPTVTMADIDVAAINEALSDAIERAKAMDPAELNRRIKELEAELAKVSTQVETVVEHVETTIEVVPQAVWDLVKTLQSASLAASEAEAAGRSAYKDIVQAVDALESLRATPQRPASITPRTEPKPPPAGPKPLRVPRVSSGEGDPDLPGPHRKILSVLATYGPRTRVQIGMLVGYVPSGGTFGTYLSRLHSAGHITRPSAKSGPMAITDEGLEALGPFDPLPSGAELLEHWISILPGPQAKILQFIADRWPDNCTREEIGIAMGYEPSGGTFGTYLSRLRSQSLIEGGAAEIRLTSEFGDAIS